MATKSKPKAGRQTDRGAKLARARKHMADMEAKSKRRSSAQKQQAMRMSRAGPSTRARATRMAHSAVANVKADIRTRKDVGKLLKKSSPLSEAAKTRAEKKIKMRKQGLI